MTQTSSPSGTRSPPTRDARPAQRWTHRVTIPAPAARAGDGGSVVARSSPVKKVLVYAALLVFALIYIYPFVVQVSTAFKTNADAVANPLDDRPRPDHDGRVRAHRGDRLPAAGS